MKAETKKKEVTCLNCKEKVKVKLLPYGAGHIGQCPLCKELAHSGR